MVHYLPHRIWCSPYLLIHDTNNILMTWKNSRPDNTGLQQAAEHNHELWVKALTNPDSRIGIRCRIRYIMVRSNKKIDNIQFDNKTVSYKVVWMIYCPTTDQLYLRQPHNAHSLRILANDIPQIVVEKAKIYLRKESDKIVRDRLSDVPIVWWTDEWREKRQKKIAALAAMLPPKSAISSII